MNTKYTLPFDPQRLEEARQKLNAYLLSDNVKERTTPLVELTELISVFNSLTCQYDEIAISDVIPPYENELITIAHRKFKVWGHYYDVCGNYLPIWGIDLTLKEQKQLIRKDRKAHPKAYL